MSDYELPDGRGSVFKNKRKQTDKHPDFSGEVKINGKLHFFDMWAKKTRHGDDWFSFSIGNEKKPKSESNDDYQRPVMDKTKAGGYADLSDDVPFNAEFR